MKTVLDISASGADWFTMDTDAGVVYCIHNVMNTNQSTGVTGGLQECTLVG